MSIPKFANEKTLDWSKSGNVKKQRSALDRARAAWASATQQVVSRRLPYTDFAEALAQPHEGEIKTVLEWGE